MVGRSWSENPAFIRPDPVSRMIGVLKWDICKTDDQTSDFQNLRQVLDEAVCVRGNGMSEVQ